MQYEYFYGAQAEQFSFYRIPKALFTEPNFRELSTDAKVLYGILLDRMSLSLKNQWLDTVFVKLSERTGSCHRWGKAGSTGTGAGPGYLRLVTVRALKRPCKP